MKWQLQDAKARFSEFLNAAVAKGPQTVTRRGVETAVLVNFDEWKRLQRNAKPSLKEILLEDGARFDDDFVAPRVRFKARKPESL